MKNKIDSLVNLASSNPDKITFTIFAVMISLTVFELVKRRDCKSVIISLGILGTFLGIFCGLWKFDVYNIKESVPDLLRGLKLAFATSVIGMFIATSLSIIEKFFLSDGESQDSNEILKNILVKMSSFEGASKEVANKTSSIFDSLQGYRKESEDHFKKMNESLEKAVETLSKGATEEIIKALEKVISDFNNNLTEQFGDNFKQLNESVKNMIVWQENYKSGIEQTEKNLRDTMSAIQANSEYMERLHNNYKDLGDMSGKLSQVIMKNQKQIENLENGLSSLEKIGKDAQIITKTIQDFSRTIQGSISNQSEGLNKLSANLNKQLESSLGKLNEALTSLTDKFRDDYEQFLNKLRRIS